MMLYNIMLYTTHCLHENVDQTYRVIQVHLCIIPVYSVNMYNVM